MTLKIKPNPHFMANVLLTVPGEAERVSIGVRFVHKTLSELQAMLDGLKTNPQPAISVLKDLITGWQGVDCDFSPENLALLVDNYPAAGTELINAYTAELARSKEKN